MPESRTAAAEVWAANLLQLQSLRLEWDLPGLAQLWSLSTEVMFYIALPVVGVSPHGRLPHGRRGHFAVLGGLVALTWAFRVLDGMGALPDGFSWIRTLPAVGDWFVIGMLLAVVVTDEPLRRTASAVVSAAPWHVYAIAACVFWVLTTRMAGPYDLTPPTPSQASVKHIGYALVAGLVVAPSVLGARTVLSRVLSSPVLTYVGTISYGVFLWHLPLMFAVRSALGLELFEFGFWVTVLLTLAASLVVAAVSWHLLEAPLQDLARRRTAAPAPGSGNGRPTTSRPPRGTAPAHLTRGPGSTRRRRPRPHQYPGDPRRPAATPAARTRPGAEAEHDGREPPRGQRPRHAADRDEDRDGGPPSPRGRCHLVEHRAGGAPAPARATRTRRTAGRTPPPATGGTARWGPKRSSTVPLAPGRHHPALRPAVHA